MSENHPKLEEAIRLAEIGEYLYNRSYSYGNGYDEPREFGIEWQWQQSKPNEFGHGALLAEAVKWHSDMAEDGISTEATKLRASLDKNAKALEHWRQEVGKLHSQIAKLREENERLREAMNQIAEMANWQIGVPTDTEAANEHARIAHTMAETARASALAKEPTP